MSATAEEVRDILKSIDSSLKLLVGHFGAGRRPAVEGDTSSGSSAGTVAPDRDLDGQYGNPEIKMVDPRDWTGDSMKGRRMSECPAEYLEMMADRWDYFVDQAKDDLQTEGDPDEIKALKQKVKYNTKDAARARGWAARIRAGWKPAEPEPITEPPLTDDDIPF